jgi:VanZ family protein
MVKTSFFRWLPVILWAGVIFWFSSFSNPYQSLLSANIPTILPDELIGQISHIFIYMVLAFLLARALGHQPGTSTIFPSWGMAVLYAFSDETHQLFVPGRTFQLADLALDALGALVGVLLYHLVSVRLTRLASRKSQPDPV